MYRRAAIRGVTFSKNLAFFTGHAAPQYQTLKEQAEGILKCYDELFKQFGLKRAISSIRRAS